MISDSISHTHTSTHVVSIWPLCIARWRLALDFGWAWTALGYDGRLDRKDMLVIAKCIGSLSR